MIVIENIQNKQYSLFNIKEDITESKNILSTNLEKGREMIDYYENWLESVKNSVAGKDYKEGLLVPDPKSHFWWNVYEYQPYINKWKDRPEYKFRLKRVGKY